MTISELPPPEPPETCDHCGSNIIQHPKHASIWGHNDTPHLFVTIHARSTNDTWRAVLATPMSAAQVDGPHVASLTKTRQPTGNKAELIAQAVAKGIDVHEPSSIKRSYEVEFSGPWGTVSDFEESLTRLGATFIITDDGL